MAKVEVTYIGEEKRKNSHGTWKPNETKKIDEEFAPDFLKCPRLFVVDGYEAPEPVEIEEIEEIVEIPEDHELLAFGVEELKTYIRDAGETPARDARKPDLQQQAYALWVENETDED